MISFGLLLLPLVLGTLREESCIRPIIEAEESPLFIYRDFDIIDVKVYHCYFLQENTYHVCKNKVAQNEIANTSGTGYAYPTQDCLNAIRTNQVLDMFGYAHPAAINLTTNVSNSYECNQGLAVTKNTMFTLKEYSARVDLRKDVITLHSGTTCKYSYGFCYDPRLSADLVWDVHRKGAINCSKLSRILLNPDAFKLIVNGTTYLVAEIDDGFMIMKLDEEHFVCDVDFWKTTHEGVFVSQYYIKEAVPDRQLKKGDYGFLYFEDKQEMYDFVIKMCYDNFHTPTVEVAYEAHRASSQAERCVAKLEEVMFYMKVFVILSATTIIGITLCCATLCCVILKNGRLKSREVEEQMGEEEERSSGVGDVCCYMAMRCHCKD